MGHLLKITFIGLLSGLAGTGLGGLSAFLVSKTSNRAMSTILEFSAGLMTAVVCFELLPRHLAWRNDLHICGHHHRHSVGSDDRGPAETFPGTE